MNHESLLLKYMALVALEEGTSFILFDCKPEFLTVEEWDELIRIDKLLDIDFDKIIHAKLPCQNICKLTSSNVCVGCNRTIEEIECSGKYLQKV